MSITVLGLGRERNLFPCQFTAAPSYYSALSLSQASLPKTISGVLANASGVVLGRLCRTTVDYGLGASLPDLVSIIFNFVEFQQRIEDPVTWLSLMAICWCFVGPRVNQSTITWKFSNLAETSLTAFFGVFVCLVVCWRFWWSGVWSCCRFRLCWHLFSFSFALLFCLCFWLFPCFVFSWCFFCS